MQQSIRKEETSLPVLLILGQLEGNKGERFADEECLERSFDYDEQTQRILQKIECKGPTYQWVQTGKNTKPRDRKRVD